MRKKLFEEVFKRAEERSPSKTRNGICAFLENAFSEMDRYHPNKETLIRYYKKYKEGKDIKYNPNADLLNKCALYLGYDDYEDFVLKNKNKEEKAKEDDEKPPVIIVGNVETDTDHSSHYKEKFTATGNPNNMITFWFEKNKKLVIINIVVIIAIIITISTDILSMNGERWMTWNENKYEEVSFNIRKYYNDELVPFDQNKVEFFQEIENPDCDTQYLNSKGEAKLWYYKVGKGNLELYTAPGLHPINGKTLKPITRYMVREHICPNY